MKSPTLTRFLARLLLASCVASCFAAPLFSAPTFTQEMTAEVVRANIGGISPITSRDGYIYWGYVAKGESSLDMVLQQKTPKGETRLKIVKSGVANNPFHVAPAVGVDAQGHIHIAGDTHNRDWDYRVSARPHDISEFIEVTPPGKRVTYPMFFNSPDGSLYIKFRMVVAGHLQGEGSTATGLLKFTGASGARGAAWDWIGGTDYTPPRVNGTPVPALVWQDEGPASHRFYQAHQTRLLFDAKKRLHLVSVLYDQEGASTDNPSHVIYACSEDDGRTWKKADGQPAALPLNRKTADIVYFDPTRTLIRNARVALDAADRPIVSYQVGANRAQEAGIRTVIWDGAKWASYIGNVSVQTFSLVGAGSAGGGLVAGIDAGRDRSTLLYVLPGETEVRRFPLPVPGYKVEFDVNASRADGSLLFATHRDDSTAYVGRIRFE